MNAIKLKFDNLPLPTDKAKYLALLLRQGLPAGRIAKDLDFKSPSRVHQIKCVLILPRQVLAALDTDEIKSNSAEHWAHMKNEGQIDDRTILAALRQARADVKEIAETTNRHERITLQRVCEATRKVQGNSASTALRKPTEHRRDAAQLRGIVVKASKKGLAPELAKVLLPMIDGKGTEDENVACLIEVGQRIAG